MLGTPNVVTTVDPAIPKLSEPGQLLARRSLDNLRHADDTSLMAESEKELKSLLMSVKEESEKAA